MSVVAGELRGSFYACKIYLLNYDYGTISKDHPATPSIPASIFSGNGLSGSSSSPEHDADSLVSRLSSEAIAKPWGAFQGPSMISPVS